MHTCSCIGIYLLFSSSLSDNVEWIFTHSSPSPDLCSIIIIITQASLSSLLHAPTFTSILQQSDDQKPAPFAAAFPGWAYAPHPRAANDLDLEQTNCFQPASYSLPAALFSARQRYCRRYAPRHGPATGTCTGTATGIGRIKCSAPPPSRTSTMAPAIAAAAHSFVTHVLPAPAMMRLHRDLSYLFLLSPPPSLMYLHLLHPSINSDESQSSRPSQRRTSCLFFSSLFFHRPSPRLIAKREEGLPTPSCSATNSSLA